MGPPARMTQDSVALEALNPKTPLLVPLPSPRRPVPGSLDQLRCSGRLPLLHDLSKDKGTMSRVC